MKNKKLLFAGCARDCAEHLPSIFANIDRVRKEVTKVSMVCVENDSSDDTKQVLAALGARISGFTAIHLDGLSQRLPQRTLRLAFARNAVLEHLRQQKEALDFDYIIVLDMDDANTRELDLEGLARAIDWMDKHEQVAGVFPNQLVLYYDLWALRHPKICPSDVWEDVFDYKQQFDCEDQVAFDATMGKRLFNISVDFSPIAVESAFGGMGVYRRHDYLNAPNPYLGEKVKVVGKAKAIKAIGWQRCEHVHFHAGLRASGKQLFILPWMVNREERRLSIPPSFYRTLQF